MQHKKFLLATFPVHVTFIGIEVTKFLLWLFFIHVAEEFSFIFYIVTSPVRLSAPSRVTTCLTLESNNQKSNKQAMLSNNGAKETILNFILFIIISFMYSCHSVSREEMQCIFFKNKVFNCFLF